MMASNKTKSPSILIPAAATMSSPAVTVFCEDEDDVFVVDQSNKENVRPPRQQKNDRMADRRRLLSPNNGSAATLFPSLSNGSTSSSRSPAGRSLCVSHSPGRRDILRRGLAAGAARSSRSRSPGSSSGGRVKLLGRGGYGTVVLGEWKGRRVAVKLIGNRRDRTAAGVERSDSVEGEANAVEFNHDNIVAVHGIFTDDDDYAAVEDNGGEDKVAGDGVGALLVMEYVGRSNLQVLLDTMPERVTEKFTERCLLDLSRALEYIHERLVAHLDVKPSNVLVSSTGVSKLGDFGCSRRLGFSGDSSSSPKMVGTSGYQAPEFLSSGGEAASDRCDVYAFGVTAWQVRTKEAPFRGMHPHAVIYQVVTQCARPSSASSSAGLQTDDDVALLPRLHQWCWAQKPEDRPSMADVVAALEAERRRVGTTTRRRPSSSSSNTSKRRGSSTIRM